MKGVISGNDDLYILEEDVEEVDTPMPQYTRKRLDTNDGSMLVELSVISRFQLFYSEI